MPIKSPDKEITGPPDITNYGNENREQKIQTIKKEDLPEIIKPHLIPK